MFLGGIINIIAAIGMHGGCILYMLTMVLRKIFNHHLGHVTPEEMSRLKILFVNGSLNGLSV